MKAGLDREGAEEGLLATAEDPDLHAVPAPERSQEAFAVRGVPHGSRGDGDDPGCSIAARSGKELVHRATVRAIESACRTPGRPLAKPRLHPLLLEHLEPYTRAQTRDQKADRVRAQLHEGDNITGHGPRCYPAGVAGTTPARRRTPPEGTADEDWPCCYVYRDADIHRVHAPLRKLWPSVMLRQHASAKAGGGGLASPRTSGVEPAVTPAAFYLSQLAQGLLGGEFGILTGTRRSPVRPTDVLTLEIAFTRKPRADLALRAPPVDPARARGSSQGRWTASHRWLDGKRGDGSHPEFTPPSFGRNTEARDSHHADADHR